MPVRSNKGMAVEMAGEETVPPGLLQTLKGQTIPNPLSELGSISIFIHCIPTIPNLGT